MVTDSAKVVAAKEKEKEKGKASYFKGEWNRIGHGARRNSQHGAKEILKAGKRCLQAMSQQNRAHMFWAGKCAHISASVNAGMNIVKSSSTSRRGRSNRDRIRAKHSSKQWRSGIQHLCGDGTQMLKEGLGGRWRLVPALTQGRRTWNSG